MSAMIDVDRHPAAHETTVRYPIGGPEMVAQITFSL